MNNEIIKFNNGNLELDVTVTPDKDTVWLTANQMALLFDRDEKTIRKHINNTFKDHEVEKVNIPWWRSHPIHENRATESIWTEPCNPLLRATKSTKRATSA